MKEHLEAIAERIKGLDPVEALRYFAEEYKGKIVFSTSFGWEDQVITHMIFANDIPIKVLRWKQEGFFRKPIMFGTEH